MNSVSMFLKLGQKFSKRYLAEFFSELIKPILTFILGIILCFIPAFSHSSIELSISLFILALLAALPFICWSLWKIYVIYYALIPLSYEFIENGAKKSLGEIIKNIDTKNLIKFTLFYGVTPIVLSIPSSFVPKISIINFILIIPFTSLGLQAFYFKRPKENYIDVFKNCYKKLDKNGIILSITTTLTYSIPFLNIILAPLVTSALTLWYYSKIKGKI